eukprot:TRINITY_DN66273_c0_g1_i1.p1 TRINITY_DN66273_c0_g1~~TRINITY_DN66273_c0_g1_i1.p1  ORF type:complete len:173 (+),score=56.80 TRINITY_DN66273_c0_g1_i1:74-592(+)
MAEGPEVEGGVEWHPMHAGQLPDRGNFNMAALARWDGLQLPMCVGCCGKVFEVSSSDNFVPNYGYGGLWAGKDATLAFATLSLKPEDANRLDFTLGQFNEQEMRALAGWFRHFSSKYQQVGTLSEYQGWDFSSVEALAASLGDVNTEQLYEAADAASPPPPPQQKQRRIVSM